jgi:hypothetical protein
MPGHIQQPSGRGNPGPAPSPSPGPGASERVALKKEIGLVSACTIIIGERAWGSGVQAWGGAQPSQARGTLSVAPGAATVGLGTTKGLPNLGLALPSAQDRAWLSGLRASSPLLLLNIAVGELGGRTHP